MAERRSSSALGRNNELLPDPESRVPVNAVDRRQRINAYAVMFGDGRQGLALGNDMCRLC
jgi:hypothetical protein